MAPRRYLGGTGNNLVMAVTAAATNVIIFYGYDQGLFGNVIIGENFLEVFNNPSSGTQGTMTSIYDIGAFIGSVSTAIMGDRLGRPNSLLIGTTFVLVGALIQTAAYGVPQMIVGRIVGGIGTGQNTATATVWLSETAKFKSRGKLVVLMVGNCILGVVIANFLTLGFSFAPGSVSWRFPLAFQIVFCAIVYGTIPFLPESPRLLIYKGREEEALDVLAALEGDGADMNKPEVRHQYAIIKAAADEEKNAQISWLTLLTGKGIAGVRRRLFLGLMMQAMNQLSGINIVVYYFSYILIHTVGTSELLSRIIAAIASVDYLIFCLLLWFCVERFGRRVMMMISIGGCSVCLIIITIVLSQSDNVSSETAQKALGWVAVAFFFVFYACFGIGAVGIPWLYPTEINALGIRQKGSALAMATNWIVCYMCVQATPIGIANISWRFWIPWAVFCGLFVPFTYFFYPETAGRTLEDIDKLFDKGLPWIVTRQKSAIQLERPQDFIDADLQLSRFEDKKLGLAENIENTETETVEIV